MDETWREGAWVWVARPGDAYPQAARVVAVGATPADPVTVCVTDQAEPWTLDPTTTQIRPMHPSSVAGGPDMILLEELHEGALFHQLQQRFQRDEVYTYTGNILVAMNPFKSLPIYDRGHVQQYRDQPLGSMPPHVFAIANEAYYNMMRSKANQCVIISGESGAGKTETTKLILSYLAAVSTQSSLVQEQILDASPILEAFGNAKTVRNDNSSRFGKFIEVQFTPEGAIVGAKILDFLLERSRVVAQSPEERNYHIFYNLLAGATPEERATWDLQPPSAFEYLNRSGCMTVEGTDDAKALKTIREAFATLRFTNTSAIFKCLAAILHLGNTVFVPDVQDGAAVADRAPLQRAARLLGLDGDKLLATLVQRSTVTRGETFVTPLSCAQAQDSRDALAKALYGKLFSWIVGFINETTKRDDSLPFVGVLDIFGFENFATNSFEQFCINYANERLQFFFNQHIFRLEQEEYDRENIAWHTIAFVDNQACIDLISKKPLGLLWLLDEEAGFPKASDATCLDKFHATHDKHAHYVRPKTKAPAFGVRHYAGEVTYQIQDFLDKNRDTLRTDLMEVMSESHEPFVAELFKMIDLSQLEELLASHPALKTALGGGTGGTSPSVAGRATLAGGAGAAAGAAATLARHPPIHMGTLRSVTGSIGAVTIRSKSGKSPTVGAQFHGSLSDLIATLAACDPFFVRCIKPNMQKAPGAIDRALVLTQLRCAGMLETIQVRKAGYAVRLPMVQLISRHAMLCASAGDPAITPAEACRRIMAQLPDALLGQWQIGLTKVFMKGQVDTALEVLRARKRHQYAAHIQSVVRGWIQRRRYAALLRQYTIAATAARVYVARRRRRRVLSGILRAQAAWRASRVRRVFRIELSQHRHSLAVAKQAQADAEEAERVAAEARVAEAMQRAADEEAAAAAAAAAEALRITVAHADLLEIDEQVQQVAAKRRSMLAPPSVPSTDQNAALAHDRVATVASAVVSVSASQASLQASIHDGETDDFDEYEGLSDEQRQKKMALLAYLENTEKDRQERMSKRMSKFSPFQPIWALPDDLERQMQADTPRFFQPVDLRGRYVLPTVPTRAVSSPAVTDGAGAGAGDDDRVATLGSIQKYAQVYMNDGQTCAYAVVALKTSLLKLRPELVAFALDINKAVMRYVHEAAPTDVMAVHVVNYLLAKRRRHPELGDEILLQLVKATNGPPTPAISALAWQLLLCVAGLIACSATLYPALTGYVTTNAPAALTRVLLARLARAKQTGSRAHQWSTTELAALKPLLSGAALPTAAAAATGAARPLVVPVACADETALLVDVDSVTTAADVVHAMTRARGLEADAADGYVLVACQGDDEIRLLDDDFVMDIVARFEQEADLAAATPRLRYYAADCAAADLHVLALSPAKSAVATPARLAAPSRPATPLGTGTPGTPQSARTGFTALLPPPPPLAVPPRLPAGPLPVAPVLHATRRGRPLGAQTQSLMPKPGPPPVPTWNPDRASMMPPPPAGTMKLPPAPVLPPGKGTAGRASMLSGTRPPIPAFGALPPPPPPPPTPHPLLRGSLLPPPPPPPPLHAPPPPAKAMWIPPPPPPPLASFPAPPSQLMTPASGVSLAYDSPVRSLGPADSEPGSAMLAPSAPPPAPLPATVVVEDPVAQHGNWYFVLKRGYVLPTHAWTDAADVELTWRQVKSEAREPYCPAALLPAALAAIAQQQRLEAIALATTWPFYFCHMFPAHDESLPFAQGELHVDCRGVHLIDTTATASASASTSTKRVHVACGFDQLVITHATDLTCAVVLNGQRFLFITKGAAFARSVRRYVTALKARATHAIALRAHAAADADKLAFPLGAVIAVAERDSQNGWLRGSFQGQTGWFPQEAVEWLIDPVAPAPDGTAELTAPLLARAGPTAAAVTTAGGSRGAATSLAAPAAAAPSVHSSFGSLDITDEAEAQYSMKQWALANYADVSTYDQQGSGTMRARFTQQYGTMRNSRVLLKEALTDDVQHGKDIVLRLAWADAPIRFPLLRRHTDLVDIKHAVDTFQLVMMYMGDAPTRRTPSQCAISIATTGMKWVHLRDEILCQIIKQCTNNLSAKATSCERGWNLLLICCTFFPPSSAFAPYVRHYLRHVARSSDGPFRTVAADCEAALRRVKTSPRATGPTEREIHAIETRTPLQIRIQFADGGHRMYQFDCHTTAKSVLKRIYERFGIQGTHEYGLSVKLSTGVVMLPVKPDDHVMDVMAHADALIHRLNQAGDPASSSAASAPSTAARRIGYTFQFRRELWLHEPLSASPQTVRLTYAQIWSDYISGRIFGEGDLEPHVVESVVELAALRLMWLRLDPKQPGGDVDALTPAERLAAGVPRVVAHLRSQAQWAADIAATQPLLGELTIDEVMRMTVDILKTWDHFGSSIFAIASSNDDHFPDGGLLCVDGIGIKVLDAESRRTLTSLSYDELINVRYDENELHLRAGDLLQKHIIRCRTEQGPVIAHVIQSYIAYHEERRAAHVRVRA